MNKYDISDKLAVGFMIFYGLFSIERSVYWFETFSTVINESPLYKGMHEILPLQVWAILLMLFGVSLILAAIFYPRVKLSNLCQNFMLFGGVGACFVHFLMSAASMSNGSPLFFSVQYLTLSTGYIYIAFLGGAERNGKRR